jgi:hypothetical protein
MRKILSIVVGLILACGVLLPEARADAWNQKTELTFNQPVELPHVTLPAGSYWFILARGPDNRNVVEVFNHNWNRLYATLLTVPTIRAKVTSHTQVTFAERPSNQPQAMLKWYYPGRTTGREFLFPARQMKSLERDVHVKILALKTRTS